MESNEKLNKEIERLNKIIEKQNKLIANQDKIIENLTHEIKCGKGTNDYERAKEDAKFDMAIETLRALEGTL